MLGLKFAYDVVLSQYSADYLPIFFRVKSTAYVDQAAPAGNGGQAGGKERRLALKEVDQISGVAFGFYVWPSAEHSQTGTGNIQENGLGPDSM